MSEQDVQYLSEHQSASSLNTTNPQGYNPSDEDEKAIRLVEKFYQRAKAHRKQYDGKWLDYYKMFRGKQWKEQRPSYRHSEVINFVFQTIQSMIPILTDARPKLEFLPTIPSQYDLADILTKVAENDWLHNNWLMTLCEVLLDGHLYGIGLGYCGHDKKANHGLGAVCFESFDLFHAFPDPNMREVNDKRGRYFITAEPTDIDELKRDYPKLAPHFKPDLIDLVQGNKTDLDQIRYQSPVESHVIVEGASLNETSGKNQALKLTLYYLDDDFDEQEVEVTGEDGQPALDEQGQPKTAFQQTKKYPNGRKIVVASGILCEQGDFEFEDNLIPFCKYTNYILPREFYGVGDVEPIEGPQKTFNKIVSFALDVMTLMGNPIWVVGDQANIDTDNLFNKPGLVVEASDVSQVRRESGVELQPFVLNLLDRYKSYIDGISGETDLSRGVEPSDVTAASAISELQQAQQTRLRMKSRNIDAFLQSFGKMYLSRVFQFYSLPRVIRVTGDQGADQYFQFHVEVGQDDQGNKKRTAHIAPYDPNTGAMGDPIQHDITSDFDVRVSTGSTLPFAKQEKTQLSMNLFKLGVIDDEELLKNIDYPNYEAVLQRVQMKKQQMMQQQMAMKAAQGGGPPPGPGGPPPQAA